VGEDPFDASYTPAAWAAIERFPVTAERLELIDHSENVTYRVRSADRHADYVLRLHRPGYNSLEELESELQWVRALGEAGIAVPRSVSTRNGAIFTLIDIPGTGERRYAGLSEWFEGVMLTDFLATCSDSRKRQQIFGRIGEIAAAIHNQSASWEEPPGFTRRRLGVDELLGEEPRWGRFWEHTDLSGTDRELLLRTRERLRGVLADYGKEPGSFGLIHADLDPDNILLDGDDLSIIDFDDSAYGWYMYDVASALFEYRSAADYDDLRGALLNAYCVHRPLAERDIVVLPDFLLIRGLVTVGWYHERPEHTGSSDFESAKNWVLERVHSDTL
jgi:Ser/Thr protein kinase RdoA (MazF antagonist)